jgi:glycosyltransferase involved in cell wall biosynthesis
MKLSLAIPAYNEEKYLPLCLDAIFKDLENSVHASDVEIIVINNASTDNTRQVAEKYEGIILVDEMEKGLVKARRAGYLASSGDLIANLDADSILPAGWIDRVFEEFSSREDMVAFSGPDIYYDATLVKNIFVRIYYYFGYVFHLINQHVLHNGAMLQGGNFIVKRSAMEQIGGYDTTIEFYGEDTDIARRIQKVGRVVFTFKLPMYTSARRFKGEGFIKTGFVYAKNFLSIIFLKRPVTKEYNDFR